MFFFSHIRRAACLVALLGCSAPLHAASAPPPATDVLQDYSHAIPLTVSGKQAVVQLRLPRDIYMHSHAPDLRDLRLFDASGAKVAFALVEPPQQSRTSRRTVPVRIFPVLGTGAGARGAGTSLDIRTSTDGSVLSVTARGGAAKGDKAEALAGLILDLRQPGQGSGNAAAPPIDALSLELPPGTTNYTARVALEVSDDLKTWDSVGDSVLNWLVNSDTQTLENDRIEFEPRSFRYARLSWLEGRPLAFARITAESAQRTDIPRQVDTLTLRPQAGRFPQDLEYRSAIAIPVHAVGLEFAENNVVLPALLGQYVELPSLDPRTASTAAFQPAFRATFFRLAQAGQQRASRDMAIGPTHAATWVLRPLSPSTSQPSLRVSWSPATMIFLASGRPPYIAAVGRDRVQAAAVDVAQVAPGFSDAELLAVEHAVAGPARRQEAAAHVPQATDTAVLSANSRVALLWGVLLLGVLVLGGMAWRLTTQMRSEPVDENAGN